jgi:hypothetical protein
MTRSAAYGTLLRALGVLLVMASILKGHQLMTEPVAGRDMWSYRPFLIFQVEFELALGIWLLSAVFRRLAWLIALVCFAVFSSVTCYKALAGMASCGCFGKVHVNPWVTLMVIDLPAVVALIALRPENMGETLQYHVTGVLRTCRLLTRILRRGGRSPSTRTQRPRFAFVLRTFWRPFLEKGVLIAASVVVVVLAATTPVLALVEPAKATSTYEVLEPKTWIGNALPILGHTDIADQIASGNWLIVLHHIDCDDCRAAIPRYQQMARDLRDIQSNLRIALIEVPPYQPHQEPPGTAWLTGKLDQSKRWFVVTPAAVTLANGQVMNAYGKKIPDLSTVLINLMETNRASGLSQMEGVDVHD